MAAATIRGSGRLVFYALALGVSVASGASAFEAVDFSVSGADKGLEKSLRAASVLLASEKAGRIDAQDLFTDAHAEYAHLLNALYAAGYYSAVIHVLVDGREAAEIAPLDAPHQIGRIAVTVKTGPRFAFSQAVIAPLPTKTALPNGFTPGEPAESGLVAAAVGSGIDAWRAVGHAKAAVATQDVVADHANATLAAQVTLAPGPLLRFGPLTVEGHERMREARMRAIIGLPTGEIYDPKELERAKARLRRTGVFKSATLTEDEAITAPDLLEITATVVEQKRRRYTFGAELASLDGLSLTGGWLHRNLFGGAERLEITGAITNIAAPNSGVDYVLGATLNRPATFTPDTALGFGIEIGKLNEEDFTANLLSVSTNLTHVFSDELTARAGLTYDYAAISDISGDQTYRNLALPLGATWDRRDSKTDATKGFLIDAEVKPFLGFGLTDSGTRVKLDMRGYKAFGDEKGLVLAARIQAGAVLGASLLGTPRDELFYSGGGGTVRGQPYQSLGVNVLRSGVDTFKTGGTSFVGGSIEARLKATDKIGVVGFVDFGQVDMLASPLGGDNWHAGAGLGLRYATGVGPIRLDIAGPVGGKTGDGMQIYVGLGQAF